MVFRASENGFLVPEGDRTLYSPIGGVTDREVYFQEDVDLANGLFATGQTSGLQGPFSGGAFDNNENSGDLEVSISADSPLALKKDVRVNHSSGSFIKTSFGAGGFMTSDAAGTAYASNAAFGMRRDAQTFYNEWVAASRPYFESIRPRMLPAPWVGRNEIQNQLGRLDSLNWLESQLFSFATSIQSGMDRYTRTRIWDDQAVRINERYDLVRNLTLAIAGEEGQYDLAVESLFRRKERDAVGMTRESALLDRAFEDEEFADDLMTVFPFAQDED